MLVDVVFMLVGFALALLLKGDLHLDRSKFRWKEYVGFMFLVVSAIGFMSLLRRMIPSIPWGQLRDSGGEMTISSVLTGIVSGALCILVLMVFARLARIATIKLKRPNPPAAEPPSNGSQP